MQREDHLFRKSSLQQLFNHLSGSGKTIYAPRSVGKLILFDRVTHFEQVTDDYLVTANTAKSIVFPRTEKLFSYKKCKENTVIEDSAGDCFPEVVLWGSRPCDAAAFIPLNSTFNEDPLDIIYAQRSRKILVLSFSCTHSDEYCFCTSVGGGPANDSGSDILFTKLTDGDFLAGVITDKGHALVMQNKGLFEPVPEENKDQHLAGVTIRFDQAVIRKKLKDLFGSRIWDEQSLACLGCGACTYVCPVCSCFDIQDEAHGSHGIRLRCWDSCGFGLFTRHTSGYNPRATQGSRWRQRIMHKFLYLPDRLKITGCVGCGRCSRACPADINLLDTLTRLQKDPADG